MPLPFIIGGIAAVAGVIGAASAVVGATEIHDANDTIKSAKAKHEENLARLEEQNEKTTAGMDKLGKAELKILSEFEDFSAVFEKIQKRPQFKTYSKNGVTIPKYDRTELQNVSVGAGVLLGGIGSAAAGTAGGFAAAGATTAAVMALGTASTGTAIASLSGAAATNATLAAIGGGALVAGGGGVALGTTILGAATLGVGLLVGGIIFNLAGSSLSDKADEAWSQMKRAEKEINRICDYLKELYQAEEYRKSLQKVNRIYSKHFKCLKQLVENEGKVDWTDYTDDEKLLTENTALLVGLLYSMCKVQLVLESQDEAELNEVNKSEIDEAINHANVFIADRNLNTAA